MSAPVLALIRRSAARVIDEAFAELWGEKDLKSLTREAEQALVECQDYPAKAESLYFDAWRAAIPATGQREPFDWYNRGTRLRKQAG